MAQVEDDECSLEVWIPTKIQKITLQQPTRNDAPASGMSGQLKKFFAVRNNHDIK
jgi:hypothetical protein